MRRAWFLGAALVWALAGCGDDSGGDDDSDDDGDDSQETDAGRDAGRDGGGGNNDAGMDASVDAGRDSGSPDGSAPDAGKDAGVVADGGLDGGGDGGGDAAVVDAGPVSFEMVYNSILAPKCSSANCHDSNNPAANLDFSSANDAYDDLVGEAADGPACDGMNLTRVVENNPNMSLLVQKVEGNPPPCGARMPAGGMPALSANEIALIRAWIQQGAEED